MGGEKPLEKKVFLAGRTPPGAKRRIVFLFIRRSIARVNGNGGKKGLHL